MIHLQGPSKEDVLKKVESLMEEYLRSGNVQDALSSYREQKIPDRFVRHVLLAIMTHTLDKIGKISAVNFFLIACPFAAINYPVSQYGRLNWVC